MAMNLYHIQKNVMFIQIHEMIRINLITTRTNLNNTYYDKNGIVSFTKVINSYSITDNIRFSYKIKYFIIFTSSK